VRLFPLLRARHASWDGTRCLLEPSYIAPPSGSGGRRLWHRRMTRRLGAAGALAMLASPLIGAVGQQGLTVTSGVSDFTGYWEVSLFDPSQMIMLYSDPTVMSSPRALVPTGGVLRGVEDRSSGRGLERWDHEGSVWQRVVLPLVAGRLEHTTEHELAWALQRHADGTAYLRPTAEHRLHVSMPENAFDDDATIVSDPSTGEYVIQQSHNSQHTTLQDVQSTQQQQQQQHGQDATGWGWGSWDALGAVAAGGGQPEQQQPPSGSLSGWDGEDPYAGFGESSWAAQHGDSTALVDELAAAGAATECTPALHMLWWLLAIRHALHLLGCLGRQSVVEKVWLRFLEALKPPAAPDHVHPQKPVRQELFHKFCEVRDV
jgi:hypothetical protein